MKEELQESILLTGKEMFTSLLLEWKFTLWDESVSVNFDC